MGARDQGRIRPAWAAQDGDDAVASLGYTGCAVMPYQTYIKMLLHQAIQKELTAE
jgi:hypothetical protein